MVIRGGENIYPREVEEFLYGHPAVADVQVFGVPDDYYGEELCAWIRLKPGVTATEDEYQGVLPRPHHALQDPSLRPVRRQLSDDGHRQGAEIRHAGDDDQGACINTAERCLTAALWCGTRPCEAPPPARHVPGPACEDADLARDAVAGNACEQLSDSRPRASSPRPSSASAPAKGIAAKYPMWSAAERLARPTHSLLAAAQHDAGIGQTQIQNKTLGIDRIQPCAAQEVHHRRCRHHRRKAVPSHQTAGPPCCLD